MLKFGKVSLQIYQKFLREKRAKMFRPKCFLSILTELRSGLPPYHFVVVTQLTHPVLSILLPMLWVFQALQRYTLESTHSTPLRVVDQRSTPYRSLPGSYCWLTFHSQTSIPPNEIEITFGSLFIVH